MVPWDTLGVTWVAPSQTLAPQIWSLVVSDSHNGLATCQHTPVHGGFSSCCVQLGTLVFHICSSNTKFTGITLLCLISKTSVYVVMELWKPAQIMFTSYKIHFSSMGYNSSRLVYICQAMANARHLRKAFESIDMFILSHF